MLHHGIVYDNDIVYDMQHDIVYGIVYDILNNVSVKFIPVPLPQQPSDSASRFQLHAPAPALCYTSLPHLFDILHRDLSGERPPTAQNPDVDIEKAAGPRNLVDHRSNKLDSDCHHCFQEHDEEQDLPGAIQRSGNSARFRGASRLRGPSLIERAITDCAGHH